MAKSKGIISKSSTHNPIHIYTTQTREEQIKIYNVNSPFKKPTLQN